MNISNVEGANSGGAVRAPDAGEVEKVQIAFHHDVVRHVEVSGKGGVDNESRSPPSIPIITVD